LQRSTAQGRRVRKWQPGGGLIGLGTSRDFERRRGRRRGLARVGRGRCLARRATLTHLRHRRVQHQSARGAGQMMLMLDTQIVIWATLDTPKLPTAARRLIAQA
jgi:hypothetical protein